MSQQEWLQPSDRAAAGRSSIIREILRLMQDGSVLSLAGGIPAVEAIPLADLQQAAATLDTPAFQYTPTEGFGPFADLIAARATHEMGRAVGPDHVVITGGSQQALDLLGRVLLNPGDVVAMEHPGYLGAIQALEAYQPQFLPLPLDQDGLDPEVLAAALAQGVRPKLVYTVPDFSNPSGAVLTQARRDRLVELARHYGFLIVEDDPYSHLRYTGSPLHPIAAQDGEHVIRLGTLSKTLAPGLRVGWAVGPPRLISWIVRAKQAADLQASTTGQALAAALLAQPGWLDAQIARILPWYAERAAALSHALAQHAAGRIEVLASQGGMFLWGQLTDPDADSQELFARAVANGVAFVPGAAFAVPGGPPLQRGLRLSFATLSPAQLDQAVQRLGQVL